MPEASRSFHYWQQAPRWRVLSPMAGKSWQLSHEPPRGWEKAGTHHTDKTVEREGRDEGRGNNPYAESLRLRLRRSRKNADHVKLLELLVAQEHMESWPMHRSKYH